MKLISLKYLSSLVIIGFLTITACVIGAIFYLGGVELFVYLRTTLVQAIGLGIALTASLFFFLRLVWKLQALPMTVAMVCFILGMAMFVSVSVGKLYMLQYPVFVNSYGPGMGPGLPLKNVFAFFKNVKNFPVIADIARDPNDVPPARVALATDADTANHNEIEMAGMVSTPSSSAPTTTGTISFEGLEPVEPTALPEAGATTVQVNLETTEVLSEIAPGVIHNYWTFNNTVPGPLVRAREGDIVEVTIHNLKTNLHAHNVDFHAATGPGGGGVVSVVAPGETKKFRFKAKHPGLFVYHCAVPNMAVHMAHGMYGLILIDPKAGLPPVDKEFYIMQGELYTTGALGRKGLQIFDAKKMLKGDAEYITFNGRPGGLTNMEAKVGDRVRMYVGNGGVSHNSSFHIVGEVFDTVYPEASIGGALFHNVQTTNIPAGGATIVEFTVDYPGNYTLVDHALMRTDKGAWGVLKVTGEADPNIFDGDFSKPTEMKH